jgi:hypothetical protein
MHGDAANGKGETRQTRPVEHHARADTVVLSGFVCLSGCLVKWCTPLHAARNASEGVTARRSLNQSNKSVDKSNQSNQARIPRACVPACVCLTDCGNPTAHFLQRAHLPRGACRATVCGWSTVVRSVCSTAVVSLSGYRRVLLGLLGSGL